MCAEGVAVAQVAVRGAADTQIDDANYVLESQPHLMTTVVESLPPWSQPETGQRGRGHKWSPPAAAANPRTPIPPSTSIAWPVMGPLCSRDASST